MRKDLCFTYNRDVISVYNAYLAAIRQEFSKDAEARCYHTLAFGLNLSFQYNMNGGACTVHLMPTETGTAVDVRYTVVQLVGARYAAHCHAMNRRVEAILGCAAVPAEVDIDAFLLPENQVVSSDDPRCVPPPAEEPDACPTEAPDACPTEAPDACPTEAPDACPTEAPDAETEALRCGVCGAPLTADARFCSQCGHRRTPATHKQNCTVCGAKLSHDARFCSQCGRRTDA